MNYCFEMEGKGDSLTVYEAAIDAISHASIYKSLGMEWKKEHRIALGCLSDNALACYLKRHPEIKNITFALDNDDEAKFSNGKPAPNWGQEAANKYAEKYAKLGYNTTIEKPLAKDWNEDLLNIRLVQQDLANRHEEDRLQLLMGSNEELEAAL
ncbi:toprim domain-containing protein [Ruminiclostridium josui]|nr:toprim domain-containing protein [Ruminiclostridium josui]